jgi:hypothetical protein
MLGLRHNEDRWLYLSGSHTVCVPYDLASRESLYCLLHEMGHAAHRHVSRIEWVDPAVVRQEASAWRYALRCVRQDHQAECREFALRCLETYNSRCECDTGEWLTATELRNLLQVDACL